jgi:protein O-mannosyl-transferase
MRKRLLAAPLLLLLAALIAYHNSFTTPFVFDDLRLIVGNARIHTLWPIWEPLGASSRPLVQWSLAINFAISGEKVWSFHLFNLLVHWAAACTLFGVVRRVLRATRSPAVTAKADILAFIIALVWMVHPLQTESVTYLIQRSESLAGLFCLLTLYCFLRSFESPIAGAWRIISLLTCLAGLCSKPVAAVAPLLVLLYDTTFVAGSLSRAIRLRWKYYASFLVCLASVPVILAGEPADWSTSAGFGLAAMPPLRYAVTQPGVILHYLRLAFWPEGLCLDYGWLPADPTVGTILATTFILGLLGLCCRACQHKSATGFAGTCFFLLLAPSSSFIPVADVIFEHRMYLPLAAVVGLAVVGSFIATRKLAEGIGTWGDIKTISSIAAGATIVVLVALTVLRNGEYSSEITLWKRTVEVSPSSARAHYDLGTVLLRSQQLEEAAAQFQRATEIRPPYPEAYYNLGNVRLAQNQPESAAASFRRTLLLTPNDWQAHNNLGVSLLRSGQVAAAVAEFKETLQLNPQCLSAQVNLKKLALSFAAQKDG